MISQYRVLAERIKVELAALEQVVERVERALQRAAEDPEDRVYFLTSVALDLHGFYSGVERLLQLIARNIDQSLPAGPNWHRELLSQLTLLIPQVRPAVLAAETQVALIDYLGFRHVVRNVYTFNLNLNRVTELAEALRNTFSLTQRDLLAFVSFLDNLSTADEDS